MTIRLVRLTPAVFTALAAEDTAEAERLVGLPLPVEFTQALDIWRYMLELISQRPDNADWLMQAVVRDDHVIGNAGFKGAPTDGVIELGYRIAVAERRHGNASAAVQLLLEEARLTQGVDAVIARISPDNAASVGVVTKAGFVQVEDHMHPRWGLQLEFRHDLAGHS